MPSATKIEVGVRRPSSRKAANGRASSSPTSMASGSVPQSWLNSEVPADQRDNVAGDAEEQRLAEGHDAGEAPAQVEADREQREDQDVGRERHELGPRVSSEGRRDERRPAARSFDRPAGRGRRLPPCAEPGWRVLAAIASSAQHSFGSTMSDLLDRPRSAVLPASALQTAMYMFILQCILPGTISAPPPGPFGELSLVERGCHLLARELAVGRLDRCLVELDAAIHAGRRAAGGEQVLRVRELLVVALPAASC